MFLGAALAVDRRSADDRRLGATLEALGVVLGIGILKREKEGITTLTAALVVLMLGAAAVLGFWLHAIVAGGAALGLLVSACAGTANKCLHGIPGLCFVVARRDALAAGAEPPRTLYLHLPLWLAQQDRQSTPFTPPVNGLLALDKALQELAVQGGWAGRHARYSRLARRVRKALTRRGVEPLFPPDESSSVLTSYRIPEGMSYEGIHDALKQWGFVIYAGQGSLVAELFRISTMGDISDYDMERLLAATGDEAARKRVEGEWTEHEWPAAEPSEETAAPSLETTSLEYTVADSGSVQDLESEPAFEPPIEAVPTESPTAQFAEHTSVVERSAKARRCFNRPTASANTWASTPESSICSTRG